MIFDDTELLADVLNAPLLVVTDVTLSGTGTTKAVRVVGKKKAAKGKPKAKKAKAAKRPKKGKPAKAAKTTKAPKKAPKVAKDGETKAGKKSTRPNALGKTGRGKGRTPVVRHGNAAYGKRVKKARLAKGLAQHALAAKLEITQAHISNIETGTVNASEDLQRRLAKALGL